MDNQAHMNMPPDECPNGGICLTVLPVLRRHSEDIERHEQALRRIGTQVDKVAVEGTEREKVSGWVRTGILSILGVGLVQIASTIWWASSLNASVLQLSRDVADHEARLRTEETASVHDKDLQKLMKP